MNSRKEHNSSQSGRNAESVPQAPRGRQRFMWLGPSFLWMLSAAGSGELLFTPRIAALYGYNFFWALLAAVLLKWFINREWVASLSAQAQQFSKASSNSLVPRTGQSG